MVFPGNISQFVTHTDARAAHPQGQQWGRTRRNLDGWVNDDWRPGSGDRYGVLVGVPKRNITVLIVVAILASVVGCGSGGSSSGNSSGGSSPSSTATTARMQIDADSAGYIEKINNIYNTSIVSNDPNVFKAEYEAGFIQGNVQKDQIPAARDNSWDGDYLTDPTHSYPTQLPPPPSQLAQAQKILKSNWEYTLSYIRDTARADVKTNFRRLLYRLVGIYDGATKNDPQGLPFDEQWYPQFSPAQMQVTYETPAPTFMDIYYLNATGDLFNFLPPPGPTDSPMPSILATWVLAQTSDTRTRA